MINTVFWYELSSPAYDGFPLLQRQALQMMPWWATGLDPLAAGIVSALLIVTSMLISPKVCKHPASRDNNWSTVHVRFAEIRSPAFIMEYSRAKVAKDSLKELFRIKRITCACVVPTVLLRSRQERSVRLADSKNVCGKGWSWKVRIFRSFFSISTCFSFVFKLCFLREQPSEKIGQEVVAAPINVLTPFLGSQVWTTAGALPTILRVLRHRKHHLSAQVSVVSPIGFSPMNILIVRRLPFEYYGTCYVNWIRLMTYQPLKTFSLTCHASFRVFFSLLWSFMSKYMHELSNHMSEKSSFNQVEVSNDCRLGHCALPFLPFPLAHYVIYFKYI